LLNVADFWTPFVGFMEHVSSSGFLSETRLKQLIVGDTPDEVINLLDEAAAGATQGITW
jgi:predicted Rossmann-fold nucleotide-binding protein